MDRQRRIFGTDMLGSRQFDYCVDSVNGNDAYGGRTPGSAFKTISALTGKIVAGTKIGLAKGSNWKEQIVLDATQNNVLIKSYGSGSSPILDCADIATAAGFTKTDGQTTVYQVTVSPALAAADTRVQVWEDSTRLVHATSIANCDATAGSYFPSSETTAPITLYIHASDNSDPATNGKVYSFSSRTCGIDCFLATGTQIEGIETRNNLHDAGSLRLGRYSRVIDCIARNGSKHNVSVRTGCVLTGVQAIEAYYDSSFTLFVFNEATPDSEGITFNDCSAYMSAISTLGSGFYGHKNTSGSFGVVTYNDCTATNCNTAVNGLDCTKIIYNNMTVVNCNYGVACTTNVDIIGGNYDTNIFGVAPATTGLTINISDGAIINTVGAVNPGEISISQNDTTISIIDSTIGTSTTTPYRIMYNGPTGLNITLLRNIFSASTDRVLYFNSAPDTLVSDYNTFGSEKFKNVSLYASLAAWVLGTGQDAHSTVG